MISILGSLSFFKLVMMSSSPAKSVGDARYISQDPFIREFIQHCPIQSLLQSVLGVRSSTSDAVINLFLLTHYGPRGVYTHLHLQEKTQYGTSQSNGKVFLKTAFQPKEIIYCYITFHFQSVVPLSLIGEWKWER